MIDDMLAAAGKSATPATRPTLAAGKSAPVVAPATPRWLPLSHRIASVAPAEPRIASESLPFVSLLDDLLSTSPPKSSAAEVVHLLLLCVLD